MPLPPSLSLLFQVGGAAVLGVGIWTLVEKSDYLSLLASSTFAVSAYILILAGGLVVVTGFLGCCAVVREQKSCLSTVRQGTHDTHLCLGQKQSMLETELSHDPVLNQI